MDCCAARDLAARFGASASQEPIVYTPKARGKKHGDASMHATSMADRVIYCKEEAEDEIQHRQGDGAGLASSHVLHRKGKQMKEQQATNAKDIQLRMSSKPVFYVDAQDPRPRRREGVRMHRNPTAYQSNVGPLLGRTQASGPGQLQEEETLCEHEDDSAGKPSWMAEKVPRYHGLDRVQKESASAEERSPRKQGARFFESQFASNIFGVEHTATCNKANVKQADEGLAMIFDGCAGRPTWHPRSTLQLRHFGKGPLMRSTLDLVVFGRDADLEGATQWSDEFAETFAGRAGHATWQRNEQPGLRHYDDHPCNHWSEATDPLDVAESSMGQSDYTKRRPSLFSGCAGLCSSDECKSVTQHGMRHISAPIVTDKYFCPGRADIAAPARPSAPPSEWVSHDIAGIRTYEKRAKADMEVWADNAEKFGCWVADRPGWERQRPSRSVTPQRRRGASARGYGMDCSNRGQADTPSNLGLTVSKSGHVGSHGRIARGCEAWLDRSGYVTSGQLAGRNRSVSPRSARAFAGG